MVNKETTRAATTTPATLANLASLREELTTIFENKLTEIETRYKLEIVALKDEISLLKSINSADPGPTQPL